MFNMSIKEWVITAVSSVSIIAFTLITGGLKVRTHAPEVSESYEMKRPESSFFSRFDLSGREDHLEVIGQEARKEKAKKAAAQAAAAKTNPAKTVAVDPKKKAKEEAAKKKAQAEAARKAKLSVAIVGDARTGLSKSETVSTNVDGRYSTTTLFVPNQPKAAAAAKDNNQQDDPQLSAGQWLSLLQNQPSSENAIAFRKAKSYLGNKAYYYDVLAQLLVDSQADRQTFAYNILKGDVSSETFYFISNPTEELKKHDSIYQKVVALYDQYKTKSQFGILSYALSISNTNSNLAALAIVKELYAKIQTQASATTVSTTTAGATTVVTTLKVDDLKIFEKLVLKLEANQNESVAQVAKSLYGSVWSAAVVASNSTGL